MSLQSRSIRSSTYRNRCLLRCCCCSPADTTLALLSLHRTNVKGWPLGLPQQDHRSRGPMWRLESHCLLERTDRAQRSSRLPAQQLARLRYQRGRPLLLEYHSIDADTRSNDIRSHAIRNAGPHSTIAVHELVHRGVRRRAAIHLCAILRRVSLTRCNRSTICTTSRVSTRHHHTMV